MCGAGIDHDLARAGELRSAEARAVGTLSNIALARGDFRRAAELLAETQALFRELGDEKRLAITINNSAYLALEMGDYEVSLALADEGRGLSRTMGDSASVVSASINLSLAALSLGRHEMAKEAIQEAIGDAPYVALTTIDDVYPERPDR